MFAHAPIHTFLPRIRSTLLSISASGLQAEAISRPVKSMLPKSKDRQLLHHRVNLGAFLTHRGELVRPPALYSPAASLVTHLEWSLILLATDHAPVLGGATSPENHCVDITAEKPPFKSPVSITTRRGI